MMTSLLAGCTQSADNRMCGTYMPYAFTPPTVPDEVPDGYNLFYVSHVGRHGSRYPGSPADIDYIIGVLGDADSKASLSDKGKEMLGRLTQIRKACEGHWGELSQLGVEQEQSIARRLLEAFPQLPAGHINILCDEADRCRASMKAFVEPITQSSETAIVSARILPAKSPVLGFFNSNSDYLDYKNHGPWRKVYHQFADSVLSGDRPVRTLFAGTYADTLSHTVHFLHALFSVNAILPDTNIPYSLQSCFTGEELYSLWSVENVRQYLEKGPSPLSGGVAVGMSKPLLRDFLDEAEAAFEAKGVTATLRFTHAEAIIPFTALMGIASCSAETLDPATINTVWFDFDVAPMAANVQWRFYADSAGDTIVKVLHNERPAKLPIETDMPPYYHWSDFRSYYRSLINN
jgi:hypothetical protein